MFQVGLKPFGWYITLVQFCFYAVFARIDLALRGWRRSTLPLRLFALLGLLSVTTMGCSNASLKYLNYPTHVIFKSCKLIPVMVRARASASLTSRQLPNAGTLHLHPPIKLSKPFLGRLAVF
jgi:hypothetical protein